MSEIFQIDSSLIRFCSGEYYCNLNIYIYCLILFNSLSFTCIAANLNEEVLVCIMKFINTCIHGGTKTLLNALTLSQTALYVR